MTLLTLFCPFAAALLTQALAVAAGSGPNNRPAEPYRITGNLDFVGASDIGSYLIATDQGHILIDAGYETTVPLIEANVAKLGFKVSDIKILLNTQAHYDHAGGFAKMKALTGARLMISERDAPII